MNNDSCRLLHLQAVCFLSLFHFSWKEKVHVWLHWRNSYRRKPRPTVRLHWRTLSWRINYWYNTPPMFYFHILVLFLIFSLIKPLPDMKSSEFWSLTATFLTWVTMCTFLMSSLFVSYSSHYQKSSIYTAYIVLFCPFFLITGEEQHHSALSVTYDQKAKRVPTVFGEV